MLAAAERDPSIEYRDIPGFPGYQAGFDGSLWSCKKPGGGFRDVWQKLHPSTNKKTGHLFVNLGKLGLQRVHVLIAAAFLGPRPSGQVCRHFPDRNPANNRADNIRYGTQKDNMEDARIHGTRIKGETHGMSRFTSEIVLAMRADYKADPSEGWTARLATKYKTDPRTIHRIIRRERWKHV